MDKEVNNQTKVLFLAVLALSILMMCLKVIDCRNTFINPLDPMGCGTTRIHPNRTILKREN